MEIFFDLLLEFTRGMGHFGVFVLMTVESSFVPFPSELVVPPAAFLAQQGELNIVFVVVLAILGSLVGASINYFLALWLGKPLVYRIVNLRVARVFLLSEKNVKKAEDYFLKYGEISTFIARLVPVVRQLISLPAGFVRMPFWSFLFWTFLGSGIWVLILAFQGYLVGVYKEFFVEYVWVIVGVVGAVAVFGFLEWKWFRPRRRRRRQMLP